jgi:hypothetical protein
MSFIEIVKYMLKYAGFAISGFIGTVLLIVVSEITQFSHENFTIFSGPSWALWVYPFYFLISFLIFYRIFRLPKRTIGVIIILFTLIFIWQYFSLEGAMFENPIPFGISAY